MRIWQRYGNAAPAVAVAVHARLPINTSFEEEANTLDLGPSPSLDVAESYLAAVKSSLTFETLTQIKLLFIEREL